MVLEIIMVDGVIITVLMLIVLTVKLSMVQEAVTVEETVLVKHLPEC
jgi:hypothetical protein